MKKKDSTDAAARGNATRARIERSLAVDVPHGIATRDLRFLATAILQTLQKLDDTELGGIAEWNGIWESPFTDWFNDAADGNAVRKYETRWREEKNRPCLCFSMFLSREATMIRAILRGIIHAAGRGRFSLIKDSDESGLYSIVDISPIDERTFAQPGTEQAGTSTENRTLN